MDPDRLPHHTHSVKPDTTPDTPPSLSLKAVIDRPPCLMNMYLHRHRQGEWDGAATFVSAECTGVWQVAKPSMTWT